MMNSLIIKKIIKNKNKIECIYETNGLWNELLNLKENFWIEYDQNIENLPDSIAVIPLLCNILPISWVFDLSIQVDNIDRAFYDCISNVKKGYQEMYPTIDMLGNLKVETVEKNDYEPTGTGALFSGGVDAFNTLFKHIEEKPTLLTVWGADVNLQDQIGWERVKKHIKGIAKDFGLNKLFVKTNFRTFINYSELSNFVAKKVNGEWWHEFQHGIGMLGLFAPVVYSNKYKILYIASSFTAINKGSYTCASDPTIDNHLRFASCKVVHDGYEYNRQDKIQNICDYVENEKRQFLPIRVCWKSSGGNNCCECEKCYRTMLGIIAEKKDPKQFGFDLTKKKRKKMMKKLPQYVKYNFVCAYLDIQNKFLKNYSKNDTPKDLLWFRKIKIKTKKPKLVLWYESTIRMFKKMAIKILNKLRR